MVAVFYAGWLQILLFFLLKTRQNHELLYRCYILQTRCATTYQNESYTVLTNERMVSFNLTFTSPCLGRRGLALHTASAGCCNVNLITWCTKRYKFRETCELHSTPDQSLLGFWTIGLYWQRFL